MAAVSVPYAVAGAEIVFFVGAVLDVWLEGAVPWAVAGARVAELVGVAVAVELTVAGLFGGHLHSGSVGVTPVAVIHAVAATNRYEHVKAVHGAILAGPGAASANVALIAVLGLEAIVVAAAWALAFEVDSGAGARGLTRVAVGGAVAATDRHELSRANRRAFFARALAIAGVASAVLGVGALFGTPATDRATFATGSGEATRPGVSAGAARRRRTTVAARERKRARDQSN